MFFVKDLFPGSVFFSVDDLKFGLSVLPYGEHLLGDVAAAVPENQPCTVPAVQAQGQGGQSLFKPHFTGSS